MTTDQESSIERDDFKPIILTGSYLTRCIRSGASFVDPTHSTLTVAQEKAIKAGDAKITGDTSSGLRVVGVY